MAVIIRQDPEVEREAIEWIVNYIRHGGHDQEELLRIERELRRISVPELPRGWDEDASLD